MRRVIPYSRQAVLEEIRAQNKLQRYRVWERRLQVFYPVIGLLPAEAQSAIADRLPIDLYRCMTWSCLAEVLGGAYLLFFGGVIATLQGFTGDAGAVLPPTLLFVPTGVWVAASPYFLIEGLIRWRFARRRGLVGLGPGELLWRVLP